VTGKYCVQVVFLNADQFVYYQQSLLAMLSSASLPTWNPTIVITLPISPGYRLALMYGIYHCSNYFVRRKRLIQLPTSLTPVSSVSIYLCCRILAFSDIVGIVTHCPRLYLRALLPSHTVPRRPVTNNMADENAYHLLDRGWDHVTGVRVLWWPSPVDDLY